MSKADLNKKRGSVVPQSRGIDPIKKILRVNNKSYKFQKEMNDLLLKILERYELDKPILMSDKLDIIWDKSPRSPHDSDQDKEDADPDIEY